MKYLSHVDRKPIYYLASPYSHKDAEVRQFRYLLIDYVATVLTLDGFHLIEPIAQCHHKSLNYDLPTGYEYWKERDRGFIDISSGVIVAQMKGWDVSVGVTDEIQHARATGKPIYYLDVTNIEEQFHAIHTI